MSAVDYDQTRRRKFLFQTIREMGEVGFVFWLDYYFFLFFGCIWRKDQKYLRCKNNVSLEFRAKSSSEVKILIAHGTCSWALLTAFKNRGLLNRIRAIY